MSVTPGTGDPNGFVNFTGASRSDSNAMVDIRFKVNKRTAPAMTMYNANSGANNWVWGRSGSNGTAVPAVDNISEHGCRTFINVGAAWAAAEIQGHWTASAEI